MKQASRPLLIIMLGTIVSRLLGFARDASMAWLLGGTPLADALSVALRLPYMLRRLLGEGTLSLALTSACVRWGKEAPAMTVAVTRRLNLLALALTGLGVVFAPELTEFLAPGLDASLRSETATLVRWALPYVALAVFTAGSMAVLHSHDRFGWPSLSPVLFNGVILLGAGACWALALPPQEMARWLVVAVVIGGAVQWAMQKVAARSLWAARSAVQKRLAEAANPVVFRVLAGIAGAAMPQLAFMLAGLLSSFLPAGHMAALFYAERLLEFPLGVIGAAVGMANAPQLARLAAEGTNGVRSAAFAHALDRGLLLAGALNFPAAAGLAAVATPLVALVLGHGAFDRQAVEMTALTLCAYAPALPAYAASRPLLGACHALELHGAPLIGLLVGLGVCLLVGTLGLALGTMGPPLGVSAGVWGHALCLWAAVRRHGVRVHLFGKGVIVPAGGSVLVFVAASLATIWTAHWSPLASLAVSVPLGGGVYTLCLAATGRLQPLLASFAERRCKKLSTE